MIMTLIFSPTFKFVNLCESCHSLYAERDNWLTLKAHEPYLSDLFQLEEGKTYKWCTCGQSGIQPMCDGSHRKSGFVPLKFTAEKTETALLCCCKNTSNPPYCDMSHFKVTSVLLSSFNSLLFSNGNSIFQTYTIL